MLQNCVVTKTSKTKAAETSHQDSTSTSSQMTHLALVFIPSLAGSGFYL